MKIYTFISCSNFSRDFRRISKISTLALQSFGEFSLISKKFLSVNKILRFSLSKLIVYQNWACFRRPTLILWSKNGYLQDIEYLCARPFPKSTILKWITRKKFENPYLKQVVAVGKFILPLKSLRIKFLVTFFFICKVPFHAMMNYWRDLWSVCLSFGHLLKIRNTFLVSHTQVIVLKDLFCIFQSITCYNDFSSWGRRKSTWNSWSFKIITLIWFVADLRKKNFSFF